MKMVSQSTLIAQVSIKQYMNKDSLKKLTGVNYHKTMSQVKKEMDRMKIVILNRLQIKAKIKKSLNLMRKKIKKNKSKLLNKVWRDMIKSN